MLISNTVEKRRKLFKKSKPFIREFKLDDMWVLWAAYKEGSFPLPEMTKEEFYKYSTERLKTYHSLMLVEDECKKFKASRGPVCLIVANTDGWKVEPHVEFFKWATKQNILRVNVRFFNWIRQNKEIGVCIVRSLKDTSNLFHHIRKYGVLNFVGRIPGGDIRGDEYVFSTRGKRTNGDVPPTKGLQRDGLDTNSTREPADTSPVRSSGDTREEVLLER
jgi:hypothetical protein